MPGRGWDTGGEESGASKNLAHNACGEKGLIQVTKILLALAQLILCILGFGNQNPVLHLLLYWVHGCALHAGSVSPSSFALTNSPWKLFLRRGFLITLRMILPFTALPTLLKTCCYHHLVVLTEKLLGQAIRPVKRTVKTLI